jgi:hypothetical protein
VAAAVQRVAGQSGSGVSYADAADWLTALDARPLLAERTDRPDWAGPWVRGARLLRSALGLDGERAVVDAPSVAVATEGPTHDAAALASARLAAETVQAVARALAALLPARHDKLANDAADDDPQQIMGGLLQLQLLAGALWGYRPAARVLDRLLRRLLHTPRAISTWFLRLGLQSPLWVGLPAVTQLRSVLLRRTQRLRRADGAISRAWHGRVLEARPDVMMATVRRYAARLVHTRAHMGGVGGGGVG